MIRKRNPTAARTGQNEILNKLLELFEVPKFVITSSVDNWGDSRLPLTPCVNNWPTRTLRNVNNLEQVTHTYSTVRSNHPSGSRCRVKPTMRPTDWHPTSNIELFIVDKKETAITGSLHFLFLSKLKFPFEITRNRFSWYLFFIYFFFISASSIWKVPVRRKKGLSTLWISSSSSSSCVCT